MRLLQRDIALFYRLWYGLVWGINEKHKVIPRFKKPVYGIPVSVSLQEFLKVRNQMWDHPQWIDEFLADADYGEFAEQEKGIIANWRKHFVKGDFLIVKHLANYSVLMRADTQPSLLYGVCGITDSIKDNFPQPAPFMMRMVLLPFQGRIIYDSLAEGYSVSFGAQIRSTIKEQYDRTRETYGIIEELNGEPHQAVQLAPRKKGGPTKQTFDTASKTAAVPKDIIVPKAMAERYAEIAQIIASFCAEKLNDEYEKISLYALAKLCRKRPSPLLGGRPKTWACGIVYAIGSSNFIFDKTQPIHMTAAEIAGWFGLAPSTAGNKASEIIRLLDISYMSAEYMLKANIDHNPAIWMMHVNGRIVDIRDMPKDVQEEAYRRGMIPYIP